MADRLVERVASTGSTNGDLLARIGAGEDVREGYWLIAARQTAGRGRLGREWRDGAGNFMGSTVVRLRADDPPPQTLALAAGVAVFDALTEALKGRQWFTAAGEDRLMLKWPNDLLLDGAKLSGILLERWQDAVVIGIGVNLAAAPRIADRETIALADTGVTLSPADLTKALVPVMAGMIALWRGEGADAIVSRWTARSAVLDTPMRVVVPGEGAVAGAYRGLEADGALRLRLAGGRERAIHAGEVALIGASQPGGS